MEAKSQVNTPSTPIDSLTPLGFQLNDCHFVREQMGQSWLHSACAQLCEVYTTSPRFFRPSSSLTLPAQLLWGRSQILSSLCGLVSKETEADFFQYFMVFLLSSSHFKKGQVSGIPTAPSMAPSLLPLREADMQCILKLEEVLKVRLRTQLPS